MKLGRNRFGEKEFSMVKKSVRRTRRTHTPAFKAQVAVTARSDLVTRSALCSRALSEIFPGQVQLRPAARGAGLPSG